MIAVMMIVSVLTAALCGWLVGRAQSSSRDARRRDVKAARARTAALEVALEEIEERCFRDRDITPELEPIKDRAHSALHPREDPR